MNPPLQVSDPLTVDKNTSERTAVETVTPDQLALHALSGFPLIIADDDLPAIILNSLDANKLSLQQDSVLVIAQKIVSKAEGRIA